MKILSDLHHGQSTKAKSLRSAAFVIIGFGGQNVLRLGGNLILTRLLFPEAFGLMALVQIFLIGLQMFSDIGINTSLIRDPRAEEKAFRDTAWTLQILRGILLWLLSCAVAYPAYLIYDEPQLLALIPVAGLTAAITGFRPTKVALANRNLQIGAQVMTELAGKVIGLATTIAIVFIWRDIWSLVVGGLLGSAITIVLQRHLIPGDNDRWHWDRPAAASIYHLGKFIFLGSVAGFLSNQGDRAILGGYITLEQLGIYTVGFTMANVSLVLVQAAGSKIGLPIYRRYLDLTQPDNRRKVFRARRGIVLAGLCLSAGMALVSVPLIHFLYDTRYAMSGPILVLVSISMIAQVAVSNYDGAYMAHGDGRSHFTLTGLNAFLQTGLMFLGAHYFGIFGVALAPGITMILTYPLRVKVVRRYGAWDPALDLGGFAAGMACILLSVWIWREQILALWAWGH